MIERETFDWGVCLTVHPLKATKNQSLVIRSEVRNYRAGRGCEVRITFSAASLESPLRLLDAQTWREALSAIIADTRAVQAEMKATAGSAGKKRR